MPRFTFDQDKFLNEDLLKIAMVNSPYHTRVVEWFTTITGWTPREKALVAQMIAFAREYGLDALEMPFYDAEMALETETPFNRSQFSKAKKAVAALNYFPEYEEPALTSQLLTKFSCYGIDGRQIMQGTLLECLEEYTANERVYHVENDSGKIFWSQEMEKRAIRLNYKDAMDALKAWRYI